MGLFIYSDGGARGNPGHAAIGIIVLDKNKHELTTYKEYIGIKTNNQAEYLAVIKALKIAAKYGKKIHFYSDSELVVMQLTRRYKVKNREIKRLFEIVKQKEKSFDEVSYRHVHRENKFIQKADSLVNEALDERKK